MIHEGHVGGCAIEFFHAAALIHDDIMDASLLRRGQKCAHIMHGEPLAINAGDYALGLVCTIVVRDPLLDDATKLAVLDVIGEMSARTVEGQALDVGWVRDHIYDLTPADYLDMALGKTGYYSGIAPLKAGALIGGGSAREIEALQEFGKRFLHRLSDPGRPPEHPGRRRHHGQGLPHRRPREQAHAHGDPLPVGGRWADRRRLVEILRLGHGKKLEQAAEIVELLNKYDSLGYARRTARELIVKARLSLDQHPRHLRPRGARLDGGLLLRKGEVMDESVRQSLRALPAVEELLNRPAAASLLAAHPRTQVVEAVRAALETARKGIIDGEAAGAAIAAQATAGTSDLSGAAATGAEDILARAAALLADWQTSGLRPVLNLTGVVIHTNLGRAPLSQAAVREVTQVARSYSNLEYDLEAGARGNRETHIEALLTRLTGAEAAFAVNNNAAAVLLLLMALAPGREVLVSRGQLVEIGGSFRLPDIMRAGGVRLVEVGTTNRTRIEDYEAAITPGTAMLLRVHTSNYRIMGFTEEADLGELVELGRRHGVIVADDLGSGALHDLDAYRGEPTVAASLRAGVDVVCFSGDKLLGGPQAGIILGRCEIIDRLRKHPVARALRLDKMTLAALEATLRAYQDPEFVRHEIPVLRSLTRTPTETASLAARLMAAIDERTPGGFITEVEETSARAGGGSMPLTEVLSHAVRIRFPEPPVPGDVPGGTARPAGVAGGPGGSTGEEALAAGAIPTVVALEGALRRAAVPVIARVSQDSLHLDVLALDECDLETVADSVAWAIAQVVHPA